ncbi:hypothetical protein ACSBR1_029404 [Camellia fascicularis]
MVTELIILRHIRSMNANSDRVLFHYNGHGVPKPIAKGEIWVFNKLLLLLLLLLLFFFFFF